ncbi:MAG: polysaccharide biosynthesis tyrosine autokinase [Chloroflexi bacterium]|nr:polysaccharide biosynthesis tyrosine autokinase [Chloroflexota bacterium]
MDEETLDIREYANVLLARWWILALGPLVAVLAALGIFLATPVPTPKAPEFQATTNVVLMGGSASFAEYPDLAKSTPVLEDAISALALSMSVAELRSKLAVSNVVSQMVSIQATDAVPAAALRLADGVAQSYVGYLDSLREPQFAAAQEQLALSLASLDERVSAEAAEKAVASVEKALAGLTSRSTPAIVLAPAEVLQEPAISSPGPSSHLARNTALAAMLGFILAVVVIFLLEYLQNPVRSPAQMERRYGLSNLGSVPRWRKARGASSSPLERLNSETGLSESVSQVAASLDFTATACQTKTVAVTSPGKGDGRSSLVSCLGVALSNHWRQVILVDSDFRHPSLHHHFHLDNSLGLSNLLSNPDLELADVVQSTNYPRLQVITSGTVPADPTNLVSSPRMSWVLERVKESADLVLIDTAPSLDTAESTLMAAQVDAVVMAVNATQTRQGSMDATLENLRRANRNILGFIWNQRETGPFSQSSRSQRYFRTTPAAAPHGASYRDASPIQEAVGVEPALSARS